MNLIADKQKLTNSSPPPHWIWFCRGSGQPNFFCRICQASRQIWSSLCQNNFPFLNSVWGFSQSGFQSGNQCEANNFFFSEEQAIYSLHEHDFHSVLSEEQCNSRKDRDRHSICCFIPVNVYNSQVRDRLKPRTRNSIRVSHMDGMHKH